MTSPDNARLSHVDDRGQARMVDVSSKATSERIAVATARLTSRPDVIDALLAGDLPKGEALAVARVAGIAAAKRTADLIPLCHPLTLEWVDVAFEQTAPEAITITATAKTVSRTGVEMEALTAASVAALTLYDMAKSADKGIQIGPIRLEKKTGGKSGTYVRSDS